MRIAQSVEQSIILLLVSIFAKRHLSSNLFTVVSSSQLCLTQNQLIFVGLAGLPKRMQKRRRIRNKKEDKGRRVAERTGTAILLEF